jgi:hypothetical protein
VGVGVGVWGRTSAKSRFRVSGLGFSSGLRYGPRSHPGLGFRFWV